MSDPRENKPTSPASDNASAKPDETPQSPTPDEPSEPDDADTSVPEEQEDEKPTPDTVEPEPDTTEASAPDPEERAEDAPAQDTVESELDTADAPAPGPEERAEDAPAQDTVSTKPDTTEAPAPDPEERAEDAPAPDTVSTKPDTAEVPAPDPEERAEHERGQDAVGSKLRRGAGTINWRRNLYALFAAQILAIIGFNLRLPFLPFFLGDVGVETSEQQALWAGVINAAGAGVMAIAAPIWGMLSDKYGRKPMLLRAQFAAFVTLGLMAFATSPWQLLGLRMVEGGLTGTVTAATALVAVSTPKERLGFSLGLIQTAVFSGAALGPLFGGVLADSIGFRPTFVAASISMLAGGLITLFLVKERFTPPRSRAGETAAKPIPAWQLILAPMLLGLTFAMLAIRFTATALQPIMPLFVQQLADTGAAASLAGVTLGVLGITSAISSVILGRLGDRRGHRNILLFCALGGGLIYLPMALAQNPWQLIALQAVFGIFAGGMIPAANAMVANVTDPSRRGVVYGLLASAGSLGGFFGPLAGAGLAAGIGFRFTFVATGIVLLLVVAVLLWSENRAKKRGEPTTAPSSSD